MEKFLKYMLLGIAFILVGIVAAVICIIPIPIFRWY